MQVNTLSSRTDRSAIATVPSRVPLSQFYSDNSTVCNDSTPRESEPAQKKTLDFEDLNENVSSDEEFQPIQEKENAAPTIEDKFDSESSCNKRHSYYLTQVSPRQNFRNNIGTINRKQYEFVTKNSDAKSPRMTVSFIQMKERMNSTEGGRPMRKGLLRERSLVFINPKTANEEVDDIGTLAQVAHFHTFDHMYKSFAGKKGENLEGLFQGKTPGKVLHLSQADLRKTVGKELSDRKREERPKVVRKGIYQKLYRDSARFQNKIKERKEVKEKSEEEREKQDCTFSPKINLSSKLNSTLKSNDSKSKRSPQKYYSDMIKFKDDRDAKITRQRKQKLLEEDEAFYQITNQIKSRQNINPNMYSRLHSEQLKKSKSKETLKENRKLSSTRSLKSITDHLYQDAQTRCLKRQQQKTHENQEQKIDLKRSKQILANKISANIEDIYNDYRLDSDQDLDFDTFVCVLEGLGYVKNLENEQEKYLIKFAWQILQDCQGNGVSQRNLAIFVMGIENIYLDWMGAYPMAAKQDRYFGYFISQNYFIESAQEALKMFHYFSRLRANNQKSKLGTSPPSGCDERLSFRPTLNKRSKQIAKASQLNMKLAYLSSGQKVPRHEDILLSKGRFMEEKRSKLIEQLEMTATGNCTFSPMVSTPPRSFRDSELHNASFASHRMSKNVFDFLHDEGKQRKKYKADRSPDERDFDENGMEFTFKPDLSSTHELNQQVNSKYKPFNKVNNQNIVKFLSQIQLLREAFPGQFTIEETSQEQ